VATEGANRTPGARADRPEESFLRYQLYGLTVETPLPLPCPRVTSTRAPDVRLRQGTVGQLAAARARCSRTATPDAWFRTRILPDGATYLRWHHLFEFLISPDARSILYRQERGASLESFTVYLLGQVLSYVLLARGVEALHGTAVLVDGEAVLLVGDSGYGKSTLAAALLGRGYPVLTDDVAALDRSRGRWRVHAGIPRLKLFPAVARKLLGETGRGVPLNHGTAKLVLPLDGARAARHAARLRAIYVLADPAAQRACRRPAIAPLEGQAAFLEVIRAAFNLVVVDPGRLEGQFRQAARLVADVPIRRLTYPRATRALPTVCDALLEDLAGATRQPATRPRVRRTRAEPLTLRR